MHQTRAARSYISLSGTVVQTTAVESCTVRAVVVVVRQSSQQCCKSNRPRATTATMCLFEFVSVEGHCRGNATNKNSDYCCVRTAHSHEARQGLWAGSCHAGSWTTNSRSVNDSTVCILTTLLNCIPGTPRWIARVSLLLVLVQHTCSIGDTGYHARYVQQYQHALTFRASPAGCGRIDEKPARVLALAALFDSLLWLNL